MEEEHGDRARQQVALRLHLSSERGMLVLSSLSSFYSVWNSSPWDDAIHVFPPQLIQSTTQLTDVPGGLSSR